jgi:hypothetical protein
LDNRSRVEEKKEKRKISPHSIGERGGYNRQRERKKQREKNGLYHLVVPLLLITRKSTPS